MHWLHQVVDDAFQHDVKEPAKYLAQNTSEKLEKVDLKLEVSAARGIGVKGSGSFDVSFIPAGYEQNVSLMLELRNSFEIDFSKSSANSSINF